MRARSHGRGCSAQVDGHECHGNTGWSVVVGLGKRGTCGTHVVGDRCPGRSARLLHMCREPRCSGAGCGQKVQETRRWHRGKTRRLPATRQRNAGWGGQEDGGCTAHSLRPSIPRSKPKEGLKQTPGQALCPPGCRRGTTTQAGGCTWTVTAHTWRGCWHWRGTHHGAAGARSKRGHSERFVLSGKKNPAGPLRMQEAAAAARRRAGVLQRRRQLTVWWLQPVIWAPLQRAQLGMVHEFACK